MEIDDNAPTIPEFYRDRSIFVTGFSGFMGKVLVEKIIYSCPDLKNIYVLIRGKRGLDYKQRLEKILNSELYGRVREQRKDILNKIVPMNGDVTMPQLGLTEDQRNTLRNEVSIIFHCAASVRFDDSLPTAVNINVRGTKSVVEIALEMAKLVAFIHVSTAYSNCDRFDIEEKVYSPHADWRRTLNICDKIDSASVNILSQKYMNYMPNTYVFAKSLGEHIVSDYSDILPVVIFRPSIVISIMDDPVAGWIDNLNGPTGLLVGYATGVVRTSLLDSTVKPDFLPVDLAIRGLIVCSWGRVYRKNADGIHFYNWCTKDRSVTYDSLIGMGKRLIDEAPMKYVLWRPTTHTTGSFFLFYLYFILFQLLPAVVVDTALRVIGQKPMLLKIQRKVFIAMQALSHFTLNYFHFHNDNGYAIAELIKEEDRTDFYYIKKQEEVDNYKYFLCGTKYFQRRFIKMKPEDNIAANKLRNLMYGVDLMAKSCFTMSLLWCVYSYNLIPRFFNVTRDYLLNF